MKKSIILRYLPFIILLLISIFILITNPLAHISFSLQDLLYQMPNKIMENLYIIPANKNTDTRQDIANLITALNADPTNRPAVIGIDVPLYERSEKNADDALFKAIEAADNVVLSSLLHYDHQIIREHNRFILSGTNISSIQTPVPPLDTASRGYVNIFLDQDGSLRHCMPHTEYEGEVYSHFAYTVYQKYLQQTQQIPPKSSQRNGMWYINFSGKPGAFDLGITWQDILNGNVAPTNFKDAIVLLSMPPKDLIRTPLGMENHTEVLANMIQMLTLGDLKHEVPIILQAICLFLLLCGYRLANKNHLTSILALAGAVILWPLLCMLLYHVADLLFEPLYPPLCAIILFVYHLAIDWLIEMRKRLRTRYTLRRYLSPTTANLLLQNSISLEKPEKREIAVLFVDIRGFTPLSESLSPKQLSEMLKEYLTLTSSVIFRNGGTLDKFIGDATMGFFNAPLPQDDYVYYAVKAAIEMTIEGEKLREYFKKHLNRNICFGIGVHCGNAVVGEIGPDYRKDYTAVGDTVNTASRLESNAKPGEVLVSMRVCEILGNRLKSSFVGERQIKGKSKPMMLYRVDSLDGVTLPVPSGD